MSHLKEDVKMKCVSGKSAETQVVTATVYIISRFAAMSFQPHSGKKINQSILR